MCVCVCVCRAVQIDPVTRSIRRTDRMRPESGRPNCSGGSVAGLHHQKPIPANWFRFSSPKTWKTRTDWKITRLRPKFPDSGDSLQRIRRRNPHFSDISLRSSEILTESGNISSNLVRFSLDLAKSHWILGKYRRNLGFLPDLCSFHHFLAVFSDLWLWPIRPPPVDGLNRPIQLLRRVDGGCIFFSPDSGGSIPGWAQTRPGLTRGQPYVCV